MNTYFYKRIEKLLNENKYLGRCAHPPITKNKNRLIIIVKRFYFYRHL